MAKNKSKKKEEKEYRILPVEDMELRIDGKKPKLVGYAAKTGIFADLRWFKEKIKKGAFSDVMEDDVRCLKNHDPNLILGRSTNGTLRMDENTIGLRYENDLPDTTTGKDVKEEVRSKLITGCSFSFIVGEDEWKYFNDERVPERTIIKIKRLFDVGPVTFPAYPSTTVAARSLDEFKAEHEVEKPEEEKNNESENANSDTANVRLRVDSNSENTEEIPNEEKDLDNKVNDKQNEVKDEISPKRQREIDRRLRKAERIINRCKKPAEI
jgi:HK97 family phage prohead protease